jgi:hypothetical protein
MKALKTFSLIFFFSLPFDATAQDIQLHYDLRHSLDPGTNDKNYPSLSFEYFKEIDSLGSFLFKLQSDLKGENNNIGQTFVQLSQTAKFWKPGIYFSLNYSGGLGVAPPSFGYYLTNAFGLGVSYPFQWKGAWLSLNTQYRYTAFKAPSHDVQVTFYLWKGLLNYKLVVAGSIVAWTENRDQGTDGTASLHGKKFAFFGDPQLWYKVKGGLSIGTRANLFYNLIGDENSFKIYPTIGVQYKF